MAAKETQIQRVMVTTDFSEISLRAVAYALAEARADDAKVTLVNVVEGFSVPFAIGEFAPTPEIIEQLRANAVKTAEQKLAAIAAQYESAKLSYKVLHGVRSVADILCEFARAQQFDLIVLASQGHGFLKRLTLGSIAERVLRQSNCPVMIIPNDAEKPKHGRVFSKIMVSSELSPSSDAVFNFARYEARRNEAALTLVHVIGRLIPPDLLMGGESLAASAELENKYREAVEQQVKALAQRVGYEGIKAVVIDQNFSVARSLVEYAGSSNCDLIVIAARRTKDRIVIGGTVERIVRQAECAVLTVPDQV